MSIPAPVPALPDTERRTQYSVSGSTGPLNVNFAIYGDDGDPGNWLQVYVNGVLVNPSNWTLTSISGPISTLARPITDAQITFAIAQTGTVQIVGARRPRRTSQFAENRGVAARDLNQAVTDVIAQNREEWDFRSRVIQGVPGDNFPILPAATLRANTIFGFDGSGSPTNFPLGPTISATAGAAFNTRTLAAAATISGTVAFVQTAGYAAVGDGGSALYKKAVGTTPGGFQSADGQWWQFVPAPAFNVRAFGAVGTDGVTDYTTAIQSAITAAQAVGGEVFLPAGSYLISSPLLITGQMVIRGVMRGSYLYPSHVLAANSTVILVTGTTSDGIQINTDSPVTIERLTLRAAPSVTAGAMIKSNANLSLNIGVTIRDVFMWAPFVGIDFENSVSFTVDNCFIQDNTGAAIICRDTAAPGSGDCIIANCTISQLASGTGINVLTTGGMRIINNKISSGVYSVLVQIGPASTASPFVCNDNSFEGATAGNIVVGALSGTPTFGGGSISGNEMFGINSCISVTGTSVGLLSQMAITGNYFQNQNTAVLVNLQNATNFIFSGNVLGGSVGSTGVGCGASANGVIGPNEYVSVSGGIPIANLSSSVLVTQFTQKGSVAVTCGTGRGGNFIGTAVVAFTPAFRATPNFVATARDSGGVGLGAFTLSGGAGGVTIGAVSSTNGGVVTVDWVAFGDS